jgi:hypothetical protein
MKVFTTMYEKFTLLIVTKLWKTVFLKWMEYSVAWRADNSTYTWDDAYNFVGLG